MFKLTKLKVSALSSPGDLGQELVRAGINLNDVIALIARSGSFLGGEFAGQLVGVFGIGGLVGTGVAWVIDQLYEHYYEKPRRIAEFNQVVQSLIDCNTNPAG